MPRAVANKNQQFLLYALLALLVVAVVGVVGYKKVAARRQGGQISVRTTPQRVRVTIDNQAQSNGRYLRASSAAPLVIKLKPGKHTMVVSRDGYTPYKYDFELDGGTMLSKDDIVLKERSPLAQVEVKITPNDKPVKIDINDGYFTATLLPGKADSVTPDVLQDKPYNMRVSMGGTDKDFFCKFSSKASTWKSRTVVTIDKKAKKCSTGGP
jgi:hypothetical protein